MDTRFEGADVFVVGGGPSLRGFDFDKLRGRHVMAVNAAGYQIPWAEVLFFRDKRFCDPERADHHRSLIEGWGQIVLTTCEFGEQQFPGKVRYLAQGPMADFAVGSTPIKEGRSGGHQATSAAIAMMARRVILLGMDCKFSDDGRSHFHDHYSVKRENRYSEDFRKQWSGWDAAARRVGVTILNAGPSGALREFEACHIDQIVGGG